MKKFLLISSMLLIFTALNSQNDFQNQFNEFRKETRNQYKAYNDSINNVFAQYLKENWSKFKVNKPIPAPKKPLPQMDTSIIKKIPNEGIGLPIDSIIQQKNSSEEYNVDGFPTKNKETNQKVTITYFGSELQFSYFPLFSIHLKDLEEKTIANAWEQLSKTPWYELINELLFYKTDMNLNDWGMYQLLNHIAERVFPAKQKEQIIFSTYIMNHLGFRMKIGRCNNQLISLITFQSTVYERPFINFENKRYYIFGDINTENGVYSYSIDYPNANREINLYAKSPFKLALSLYTAQCQIDNQTYSININKNLIDLFQTYPQTEILIYANNPISSITRKSLEKELLPQLVDKTEWEAVNFLLHFVQSAFKYKNDIEQFGKEKFFYAEELFYYPFSDCEDRSVLFSQLVRRFLGLQVVLLDYPDHVTTAVKFNSPVSGDFVNIQGNKYTICDPTYLHAKVGQSIPRYKKQKAKIFILD